MTGTKFCLAKFTRSLSVGRILTLCFRLLVNEAHIFIFNRNFHANHIAKYDFETYLESLFCWFLTSDNLVA